MKKYILIAGVNGAGKSTLYQTLDSLKMIERVNTDEIKSGIEKKLPTLSKLRGWGVLILSIIYLKSFNITSKSASLSSGFIKQKRIYLLSKNGNVEQSLIISDLEIAASNKSSEVISSFNIFKRIKLASGL